MGGLLIRRLTDQFTVLGVNITGQDTVARIVLQRKNHQCVNVTDKDEYREPVPVRDR